tara:strand:+ start:312 stop:539 length:228 start_codon:yes stop_codon:yes gene_type:complete
MQDRNIIFNHSGLADNNTSGVIEHNARANPRSGVQVDTEGYADLVLKKLSQSTSLFIPQPMGYSMSLQCVETLKK